jgi:hypothetical protein
MVEATTPRWTFEGGMREAAWEALALLWHEAEEQMEHLQYCHFPSHAREGAEAVVMPAEDHDHIGCFADQVKLTHALVWDLDEAVKEVKLLGEHEEKSSQRITELEALCKRLREDAEKLREEKTALEGMIQSRDEQEAPVVHEVILADAEPESPQPCLFNMIMRDYEESPLMMENGSLELDNLDDVYDLDDDPNEGHSDMDERFPIDESNDRDWVIESKSLSLGLRISF